MANPADTRHNQAKELVVFIEADLFTIHVGTNEKVKIVEDPGGANAADIEVAFAPDGKVSANTGVFSGEQIASMLSKLLTDESASTGNSQEYLCYYDMVTHKHTITNKTGTYNIQSDYADANFTADSVLGFTSDPAAATSITSPVEATRNNTANSISSDILYLASKAITAGSGNDFDYSYRDMLMRDAMGTIQRSIPIDGGLGSVTNMELTIPNGEKESDNFYNIDWIDGIPIIIYGVFDDGTDLVYSEACQLFNGIIYDTSLDENSLKIKIKDSSLRYEQKLPAKIIAKVDYEYVEPDVVGRPINMIYGDFSNTGDDNKPWIPEQFHCFPATGLINYQDQEYVICDHELHTLANTGIYSFVTGWNVYMNLSVKSGSFTINNSAGNITSVELPKITQGKLIFRPLYSDPGDATGLDYGNIIDDDRSNTVTVGNSEDLFIRTKAVSSPGGEEYLSRTDSDLIVSVGTIVGAGTCEVDWYFNGAEGSDTGDEFGSIVLADANSEQTFNFNAGTWGDSIADIIKYGIGLQNDANISVQVKEIRWEIAGLIIYDIGVRQRTRSRSGQMSPGEGMSTRGLERFE